MIRRSFAAALTALAFAFPAFAETSGVSVSEPYARETPPGARTGAAFLTLQGGAADDRLIAVESPAAARVEIHETRMDEAGVMRMRELEAGLPVPAGAAVTLASGGLHVMMIDLAAPLKAGETVALTLRFDSGAEVAVEAPILTMREMRAKSGGAAVGHGAGHDGHAPAH